MIYLVIEDQKISEIIAERLRKMGKKTRVISQSEELWMGIRESSPDIIILDGNSPHINALEILKDLKAQEYKGQTIVLGGESSAPFTPEISRFGAIQTAGRPLAASRIMGAIRIAQEHLNADLWRSSSSRSEVMRDSGQKATFL
ncbi:response regulator [Nitrospira sp. MA-1]|nr:response regulator [Nitrospira sp. MA-1]